MFELALVVAGAAIGKLTEIAVEAVRRRRAERAGPTLARYDDVLRWGWNDEALLRRLVALDRRVIGDALTEEREGTVQQWAPVFSASPDCWVLLTAVPRQIVGYWSFVPLRDDLFQRAKAGELLDSEITIDAVELLDVPGVYNLYFVLLGVLPEFPTGGARLINSFFDSLETLAERGVFFREACANAFTKDGKRICEGFGMTPLGAHTDFGTVYHLDLHPWPERLRYRRWRNLADDYTRAFSALPKDA